MEAPKKVGRPKKEEVEDVKMSNVEPLQVGQIVDIKHVFRALSLTGQIESSGAQPSNVVEDYLRQQYLDQGYTLYYISHIRTERGENNVPTGEQMLYVFVKYAQ